MYSLIIAPCCLSILPRPVEHQLREAGSRTSYFSSMSLLQANEV